MQTLCYIFLFLGGALIGSFLNLVSDRLPKRKLIIFGRSKCDFCNKPLEPRNLFPIFSFLFQKGRCSFCKKKLSLYYPLSEILSGLLFIVAGYASRFFQVPSFATLITFIFYAVVFSFYLIISLTDLKKCIIPDEVVYPAIGFTVLYILFSRAYDFLTMKKALSNDQLGVYLIKVGYLNSQLMFALKNLGLVLLGAVIICLFFMFLVWITKGRGMGWGDVKLGFLIGLVNGFPYGFEAIFFGFVLGALYSLILIISKRKTMKDTIAFGPFLIMGSVLTLLYGVRIFDWYTSIGMR
ncbi:prepilin peptidase [Patescibacteria group bacterium]|nr:prepilin peptidase [Patescibacteria group bacterium]MBU1952769.1 prepilin peptidase [Patescibacteria group bacterium]